MRQRFGNTAGYAGMVLQEHEGDGVNRLRFDGVMLRAAQDGSQVNRHAWSDGRL